MQVTQTIYEFTQTNVNNVNRFEMIVTHISFMYDFNGIMEEKKRLRSKHCYFTSTSTRILDEGHQSASQGESKNCRWASGANWFM